MVARVARSVGPASATAVNVRSALATLTLVAAALLWGCHRGDARLPVSGTATIDGQPVAYGLVAFQPADGHSGAGSGASLQQGKFDIPAAKGLPPGKYRVTVQAFRETGRVIDDPQGGKRPELAPVQFGHVYPTDVTVVAGQRSHFDIRLTTRRKP